MTELVLEQVQAGSYRGIELRMQSGLLKVHSSSPGASAELIALLAGTRAPRRGRVRLDGASPHRSPKLRARIGSLLLDEPRLPGRTTLEAWLLLTGQKLPSEALGLLERLQLRTLAERPLNSMDRLERRQLALVFSLLVKEPLLLALHEPFLATFGPLRAWLLEELERRAKSCIVICSVSPDTALGGEVLTLGEAGPASHLPGAAYRVHCDKPRELAQLLLGDSSVTLAHFSESQGPLGLQVAGPSADELALTIARLASRHAITIYALYPSHVAAYAAFSGREPA